MKVAVTTDRPNTRATIPPTFAGSRCLLLLEEATGALLDWAEGGPGRELVLAEQVLAWDCEALLCGPIEAEPFRVVADAGVTRYNGAGRTAAEALAAMKRRELELIRDHIGGNGCEQHAGREQHT